MNKIIKDLERFLASFDHVKDAAKELGVSRQFISYMLRKKLVSEDVARYLGWEKITTWRRIRK